VADVRRFAVVPHGAPALLRDASFDAELLRPAVRDTLAGFGEAPMLSTFGLIGPSKGLETAIAALPAVVARHPDVRYVIAGATHPEVARHGRDTYRAALAALGRRLGVGAHVQFIPAFLTERELAALLARTDVYLTPYRSPEQICSGALTFALAAGTPVVSTAYRYAVDMVTPADRPAAGVLVPFDDPPRSPTASRAAGRPAPAGLRARQRVAARCRVALAVGGRAVHTGVRAGSPDTSAGRGAAGRGRHLES
jgi:glycosyltransferase involved in cell wall biosynthesis